MTAEVNNQFSSEENSLVCINLQMMRSSHYVLKVYDEAYRPYGIRATQMPVLGMVARRQPVTIRQIANDLESERSAMSRKLQVMKKCGWVKEDKHTTGREKTFVLTKKGKNLVEKILPIRLQVQQRMMSVLSDEELSLLLSLCSKLKALSG
ncbi:MAG: MarR family winged helix-turn-helix transcriptional regulator [Acidiferrobacterales bacterium]